MLGVKSNRTPITGKYAKKLCEEIKKHNNEKRNMKKILVDFVAYRSVVIALNEFDEEEEGIDIYHKAIGLAQEYLDREEPDVYWDYDNNVEDAQDDDDAVNEDNIYTCSNCGKKFVDEDYTKTCPFCGEYN